MKEADNMIKNAYEEERQRRIERNQTELLKLGIQNGAVALCGRATPSTSTRTGTSRADIGDGNRNARHVLIIRVKFPYVDCPMKSEVPLV